MEYLNSQDKTIERNYLRKWQGMVQEYELVKQKKHTRFRFAGEFYKAHGVSKQNFIKYYNRYKQSGQAIDLLPAKRGPKWKARRLPYVDNKIIQQRKLGLNRYEIFHALSPLLKHHLPGPSTIYRICRKNGLGRMNPVMQQNKRKIIATKAGELGHIDCHHMDKTLITGDGKKYYLVCVIDSCTRIAWAEVVDDVKSLTVMFAALKCINMLNSQYQIRFERIISDNGPEFASKKNIMEHPFERMLLELGIKHTYTRPYKPQTNGKVERFWRTLNDDLINGTDFNSLDEFKQELLDYMIYYNEFRPHSTLSGLTPKNFNTNLSPN